jgi:N-acetylmuramoyl-L-alanine amidase
MMNRYDADTGLDYINLVTDDMTKYHTFDEVNTSTPVIIMEAGYLNLDKEFLTKQADKAASGITEGILCYLRNQPLNSPEPGTATP